jgi:integrase
MTKPAFGASAKLTRTHETVRGYLKAGFVLLARANKKVTDPAGDVIDAFRILFEDPDLVYRPATTRAYQQQVKAVIARKLHDGELSQERSKAGFAQLKALLIARRGPCPKRTSRGKLKDGTHAEFRKIIADFARRSRLPGGLDRTDTVLSLMVKVGPYLGLRPCEWLHARIEGRNLNVVNAKWGNGRSLGEVRAIGLSHFSLGIEILVSHLLGQVRLLFAEAGSNWRQVLGRLGERLARLCARIGIRRWSLYTTRHVAMANWKMAGLNGAEIAALAGHSSTRTARQHYASGCHGWTADFACARPDPNLVTTIAVRNSMRPPEPTDREFLKASSVPVIPAKDKMGAVAIPSATPYRLLIRDIPVPVPSVDSWEPPTFGMR